MPEPSYGELREGVWASLMKEHAAAYPLPAHGHHPNFRGSGEAARRLLEYLVPDYLTAGQTVYAQPDFVLKAVRQGLLERGVHLVVPAKYGKGYRSLQSGTVKPSQASTIAGAEKVGRLLTEVGEVESAFIACVALGPSGEVLSKGYGFHLPEGLESAPCYTVIHPFQSLAKIVSSDVNLRALIYGSPEKVTNLSTEGPSLYIQ